MYLQIIYNFQLGLLTIKCQQNFIMLIVVYAWPDFKIFHGLMVNRNMYTASKRFGYSCNVTKFDKSANEHVHFKDY